jgi:GT2 family glycosyltransferase
LFGAAERAHAGVAGVLVLDYEDNTFQSNGSWRFDLFGHGVSIPSGHAPEELFCSHGFSFIRRDLFWRVGGYDDEFFLYGEEGDLSWRAWIAGDKIVYVPTARIHHRGAAEVNPKGGERIVELRTSDSKRFYANRNHLLILMKNCQHVLLLLLVPALCLLVLESLGGMLLSRRWSFFKRSCLEAVGDCWRLRRHICEQRRSIRTFRKRGDLWMLRFFSWRFGRWQEYKRIFTLGIPIVDKR